VRNQLKFLIILLFKFLSHSILGAAENAPSVLYLTWMHDPTTTMTVHWHTDDDDQKTQVAYRKKGQSQWQFKEGIYGILPETNLLVHTVELDGLESGQEYQFSLVEKQGIYKFNTLPKTLSRPIRFVVGGDAYFYLSLLRKMNEQIAAKDPDFVVVGGDIAYTNGRRALFKGKGWEIKRWQTFLKEWKRQMIASDGRMIPIVPILGNHDVKASTLAPMSHHFLFYELFAMPEKEISFRVLDAGDYLSLFLLDSGHTYHIEGQQTQWLKKMLSERENIPYKMAAYHVAAYPSVYPYRGQSPSKIRTQWNPLFERYHLNVAFEHHNHAYKRTHPIKGNKIDPDGVIYMGDGSWGVTPRKPKKLWYLASTAQANAVCLITLSCELGLIEALSIQGEILDSVATFPTHSMVAWNEGHLLEN
jgi:acid phosphatase type 7